MTTYVAGAKGVVQCAQVRSNYFVPSDGGLLLSKTKMRVLFVSLTSLEVLRRSTVDFC